jgi:hypothetical protein
MVPEHRAKKLELMLRECHCQDSEENPGETLVPFCPKFY